MKKIFTLFILLVMGVIEPLSIPLAMAQDGIVFIVNAQNPTTEVTSTELKNLYFKRKRYWADGTPVRFIDRSLDSTPRRIFVNTYLEKSIEEIELYWVGQKLYSGDSAPLKESSDTMTIQFVSTFKGAVGYVPADTNVTNNKIKILKVQDTD